MSDAEWAVVRTAMPVPRWLEGRGGKPEVYCHRQLVDAVRYLVAGGITWRAMPADFPAWDRVYAFFRRWRDKGLVTEVHDRLRDRVREAAGRDPEPTAGIIDAQPVKAAASVPAASRGFDGGKKVNGRKRHIVVDTFGLLLAVTVTAASVTDRDAGQTLLLGRAPAARPGGGGAGDTPRPVDLRPCGARRCGGAGEAAHRHHRAGPGVRRRRAPAGGEPWRTGSSSPATGRSWNHGGSNRLSGSVRVSASTRERTC
ncbi:IS5 family transposase [Streptomyces sp. NPDC097727]|uniref:IS5 family transposase n=1 Tax=Streptomyces sp. NPDC097727 TaxID=3366092 RepID=UPI003805E575